MYLRGIKFAFQSESNGVSRCISIYWDIKLRHTNEQLQLIICNSQRFPLLTIINLVGRMMRKRHSNCSQLTLLTLVYKQNVRTCCLFVQLGIISITSTSPRLVCRQIGSALLQIPPLSSSHSLCGVV